MFPAAFDYHRAGSLDEAVALLGSLGDAKLLAGGHTLIPMMKLRLAQPAAVVDIGGLAELRGVSEAGGTVRVNGERLSAGDAVRATRIDAWEIDVETAAELVVWDLG